jgi:multidrug efflux system membrane fusion protein
MSKDDDILKYTPPTRLKLAACIALIGAAGIVAFGIVSRDHASAGLAIATTAQAVPTVNLVTPSAGGARDLVLPGDVRAFNEAPIYAQVSGYLQDWYVDIGTKVKAGQMLALIETPDLDQQLAQAQANLETAIANAHLAATTAQRWNALLAQDAVSQQDADDKNGALQANIAELAAGHAEVQRLQAMEAFKRITAPFDGVVTSRSTDIGALISVGTPNQPPLFTVDDEHRLRIYVSVPQAYSADIKPGMTARFTVPEYPGQSFTATLDSTAEAINANTGTLLVQFQTDNTSHQLQPGDYAQVKFNLPADTGALTLPSSALMFRDAGMEVATLGPNNRVRLQAVTLGRDFGPTVEIATGLNASDRVINDPPDVLRTGDVVQIAPSTAYASPGSHE